MEQTENKNKNQFWSFLLGLIIGRYGIPMVMHLIYWVTIIILIVLLKIKI